MPRSALPLKQPLANSMNEVPICFAMVSGLRLRRAQAGSGLVALRRLLSAPAHAPGLPRAPAPASQPL